MVAKIKLWQLYFDRASRSWGAGVEIVFFMPTGGLIPYSISLLETCSNNAVEYEAHVVGLELAIEILIDQLEVFNDS